MGEVMAISKRKVLLFGLIVCSSVAGVAVAFYFIGKHASTCPDHPTAKVTKNSISMTSIQQTGRLPRNIEPILYKVELFPQIYGDDPKLFSFTGFVFLKFKCLDKSKNITMNMNKLSLINNTITIGAIDTRDFNNEVLSNYTIDEKWQFVTFHLGEFMEKEKEYSIQMNFTGPLLTDFAGLYLSTFQQRTENRYVAATQFSPTDARKAFPCLDEPDRKAEFDVTLVRRKDMVSLSNMPKATTIPRGNEMVADIYQRTPKMSTYLLAFVVGDLVSHEMPARPGLNFTAWSDSERLNKTQHALAFGAKVLTFFEDYFGINFPLPKQDIFAVPETAVGAMENWGLIIFNEERMYYKPKEYSKLSLKRCVNTIAHEIAHQWFGNLVTMEWWSDLMLKEGFAVYFEDIATESVYPDWDIMDQFVLKMHTVFEMDGLTSSHPVYMKLYDTTQIRQVFDDISYTKGGCMIRMLNFVMGDKKFQRGMKRYLTTHQFGNVGHNDLWVALDMEQTSNVEQFNISAGNSTTVLTDNVNMPNTDVRLSSNVDMLQIHNTSNFSPKIKDIMDTWILQKNFPVITVHYLRHGRLHITQECFLNNYNQSINITDTQFRYIWKIPLTFTSSIDKTFNHTHSDIVWMESKELVMINEQLPNIREHGNWILFNVKQWGYYRVHYDLTNWANLIEQLKTDHSVIHVVNRAQIINDIFSLAKAKRVPLQLALTAFEYLTNETSYTPWITALKEMRSIDKFIKNEDIFQSFKTVVLGFAQGLIITLNKNKASLGMMDTLLRAKLFALCSEYDMKECVEVAKREFSMWRDSNGMNHTDVDIRSSVVCTSVKYGTKEDWDFVLREYNKTYNINDKKLYLSALACTKDKLLRNRLITLTEDKATIQGQLAIFTLTRLARNPASNNTVWEHVTNHWMNFMDELAGSLFSLDKLVIGVTDPFVTRDQMELVEEFMKKTSNLGPAAQTFNQVLEGIHFNVKWLDENYHVVEQWVQKMTSSP